MLELYFCMFSNIRLLTGTEKEKRSPKKLKSIRTEQLNLKHSIKLTRTRPHIII